MNKKKLLLLNCLIVITFFSNCQNSNKIPDTKTPDSPSASKYLRGVWLTNVGSDALYTPNGISEVVKNCRKSGINHIFVVMWNKGRTLYPSRVMKETFGIEIEEALKGRDPLQELITTAHKDSIKVFAWMEYGFAAENNGFGEHILRIKPEWAALGEDGNVVTKNGFKWMNALDPVVQNFMLSLLKEVVINYPQLDGIQGDDRLPALPSECGYNPEVLTAYKKENNGLVPKNPKTDAVWVDWRANKLNLFAQKIYTELKAIRPALKIAMAPSIYPFAKTEYLQDWPTWVANGWVDIISPQIYRYDITAYRNELNKVVTQQVNSSSPVVIAPGVLLKVGTYTASETFLQQMIDENRAKNVNHEIFFYYEGIKSLESFFQKYSQK